MAGYNEVRQALSAWQLDNGAHPFGEVGCRRPCDRTRDLLTQASAILSVLSAASSDAQSITGSGQTSDFDMLNIQTFGKALDGIGSLVNLVNFLLEE